MYDEIIKNINKYEKRGNFTHAVVSDSMILNAEKMLKVNIPEQYKWFLKKYGHGGIDGIETLGVGKTGKMVFIDKTLEFRKYGLSNEMIVIENCDEWIYCLNTKSGNVVIWSLGSSKCNIVYKDFIEYLNDRINDAIENM